MPDSGEREGQLVPVAFGGNRTCGPVDVATAVNAHGGPHGRLDFESETFCVTHSLRADGFDASEDGTGRGTPPAPVAYQCHGTNVGPMGALRSGNAHATGGVPFLTHAFDARQQDVIQYGDMTGPLDTDGTSIAALTGMRVRRLLPVECERLQGFPDGYTDVSYRGKPAADGPRYKALGNSWAVPCVRWIFERITRQWLLGE